MIKYFVNLPKHIFRTIKSKLSKFCDFKQLNLETLHKEWHKVRFEI